jgi:hypothetical protein
MQIQSKIAQVIVTLRYSSFHTFRTTLAPVFQVLAASVVAGAREASANPDLATQTQGGSKMGRTVQAWCLVIDALQRMVSIAKFHETTPLLNTLFKV